MMRFVLLCLACALSSVLSSSAPTPMQCASITSRAPCGQITDSAARCASKGCCYDSTDPKNPCFYPGGNATTIKYVHMVQGSHFDAGFIDTIAGILNLWWYQHLPRAVTLGEEIEANGTLANTIALQFTCQMWILDMFFDCPPNIPTLMCPSAALQANVTKGIQKGWITWHAFPFNAEPELYSPYLFELGIQRVHALDDRFGFDRKHTISQRDVPGMTRSVIPLLQRNGVHGITIGVNDASTPPFVPRAFIWKDPHSGLSIPTLIHPYSYGGIQYEDAVIIPGFEHALVFAWRGDNAGPPDNIQEIISDYQFVQNVFPGATVFSSTFDNFTKVLSHNVTVLAQLPIIESEIGDTWIHGAGSDPFRTAFLKRVGRIVDDCVAEGGCTLKDAAFSNASRFLLKCGEHTWGYDVKGKLDDTTHWTNQQLQQELAIGAPNFIGIIHSWQEQRDFCTTYVMNALRAGNHSLADRTEEANADLRPVDEGIPSGFIAGNISDHHRAGRFTLGFDAQTGALTTLVDTVSGVQWSNEADGGFLLGLQYVTLSSHDYDEFLGQEPKGYYPLSGQVPGWFYLDFGKPNVSEANPNHTASMAMKPKLWVRHLAASTDFIIESTFMDAYHIYDGTPSLSRLRISVSHTGKSSVISCTLDMFDKTATRLPEAMYIRFNVSNGYNANWEVQKLGSWVNPYDVVPGGNHHQHGYYGGIRVTNGESGATKHSMTIESDDFAMAQFGKMMPLPTPVLELTDPLKEGAGFMLWNNLWGTNYPQWLPWKSEDANQRWRFTITIV